MRSAYRSFLIINPFGIGDVLFSTPLIRNIKDNFPLAKIFYLCNKRTFPILRTNPLIDEIFIYERDDFDRLKKASRVLWLKAFLSFLRRIKKKRIDVSLDLSLNSQFGFFSWYAGIKKRAGLDYKGRGRFLTHKIKIAGYNDKHIVEYYLDVLSPFGINAKKYNLEVHSDRESIKWADEFINKNSLIGKLIIGIAPCGGEAFGKNAYVKRWPQDKFTLLIQKLIEEFKAKIFIFAGINEKREVRNILNSSGRAAINCYEFTDLSLEKTVALMDKCHLVITNDTGPMRFADALGKKVVPIFGPTDEKVYGPYPFEPERHIVIKKDLPCRPCYRKFKLPECPYDRKCLKSISVDEVFNAAKKLING